MIKIKNTIAGSLLLTTAFAWLPEVVFADLTLGVFPRRSPAATMKSFKPLAEHLSLSLNEKVTLRITKDFDTFWNNVRDKKYDIVHFNQYHYIKSHKEFGYNVFVVNEEQGHQLIAGALSVRKDSGIKTIADLKGKTILFGGGPKAMGSYIAPTLILKQAGLIEGQDYKAIFAKNPPSAIIGMYRKTVDAAGSGDIILSIPIVKKRVKTEELEILARSKPFIHLAWATSPNMDAQKTEKIKHLMTSLKQTDVGKKVLKAAKVTNFHPASDKDFNEVRTITLEAIGEKY